MFLLSYLYSSHTQTILMQLNIDKVQKEYCQTDNGALEN